MTAGLSRRSGIKEIDLASLKEEARGRQAKQLVRDGRTIRRLKKERTFFRARETGSGERELENQKPRRAQSLAGLPKKNQKKGKVWRCSAFSRKKGNECGERCVNAVEYRESTDEARSQIAGSY